MQEYFQKISTPQLLGVELDPSNLETLKTYDKYQKYGVAAVRQFDEYSIHVSTSYKAKPKDILKATSFLPLDLLKLEDPEGWVLAMQHAGYLPAHVDADRECTVNFYFDCDGQETRFFEYESGTLVQKASFVAEHGDVYILNTKKPHDVKLSANSPRKVFGLTFKNTPYEIVREQIMQGGFTSGHK